MDFPFLRGISFTYPSDFLLSTCAAVNPLSGSGEYLSARLKSGVLRLRFFFGDVVSLSFSLFSPSFKSSGSSASCSSVEAASRSATFCGELSFFLDANSPFRRVEGFGSLFSISCFSVTQGAAEFSAASISSLSVKIGCVPSFFISIQLFYALLRAEKKFGVSACFKVLS